MAATGARALLAWRGSGAVRRLSSFAPQGPAMSPKAQHYAEKVPCTAEGLQAGVKDDSVIVLVV